MNKRPEANRPEWLDEWFAHKAMMTPNKLHTEGIRMDKAIELAAYIRALEADNRALAEDRARLDWLESREGDVSWGKKS